MKSIPPPTPFAAWLDEATHGLPANIAAVVRAELEAHYLDAIDAHLTEGLSPAEAQHAALTDLGNAQEVDAELISTHLSRGRSILAMLACLFYPFMLALLPTLATVIDEHICLLIQDVVNIVVLVFVLLTFIQLLGFDTAKLVVPNALVILGIILFSADRLLYYAIFGQLPLLGPGDTIDWKMGSPVGFSLNVILVASEFLSTAGMLWMSLRLLRMPDRLFGLLRPVVYLLLFISPIGVIVILSIIFNSFMLANLASVIGYSAVTILLALMILIFYRAAFRAPVPPQAA